MAASTTIITSTSMGTTTTIINPASSEVMQGHHSRFLMVSRAVAFCLAACWLPVLSLADTSYLVRRGDTLYGIAHRHAISISALADRNSLGRSQHLYVGQRLVVPSVRRDAVLSAGTQIAINTVSVVAGRWKTIVIHHSGTDGGTAASMDRYHRETRHMENGLAYHFVIGNGKGIADGSIVVGPRWTRQLDGGHLKSEIQNRTSLGICLVGNFDKHKPRQAQMRSLTALVQALLSKCKLGSEAVKTHQQINTLPTRCPGRYFPTQSWLESVQGG